MASNQDRLATLVDGLALITRGSAASSPAVKETAWRMHVSGRAISNESGQGLRWTPAALVQSAKRVRLNPVLHFLTGGRSPLSSSTELNPVAFSVSDCLQALR